MTFQQFLLILRARYKVALFTLLVTVLTTLVVSLLLPKQYTASAALVIDVRSPDPIGGMILPGLAAPAYMATQVDIINSDRVAQRVVKLLRMDENPAVREQWIDATGGSGDLHTWLADLLKEKLDVKPSRESNVINIEFRGADPEFAANVANAFAQAYFDVNLDLKVAPARQSASWFEDQTRTVREQLEKAQEALSAHQQKTGVVATEERLDYETAKLNELSSQLTNVQAETTDSSSKHKSASSETLAEVMQNPLVNSLKSDLARLEAKFQESNVNLGVNHPQTKRTQSEIASLRRRLASEIQQITNSIGTSYEVGKQKEKELLEAMEIQKKRVLELNRERDEIAVLKRDVEAAQRTFEGVSQRAAHTRLESQSVQTNVAMLNPATIPIQHSRPRVLLNVLISIFLGTLLGVGIALMLELMNRRIRSATDLVQAIDLPVLAVIPGSEGRSVSKLPKLPKLPKQLGTSTS
ncbi:chain length determinant protein EpsF [Nitrosospira briensis]|uniref:Chain length determinant protein EpsF n=1 Tax=Nitrosospira briensis TaxID=35799 RepID=A0A1I5BMK7_9PROT|nr:chain length determinant protein EpsF [Nitrosospira briensis]SFN75839.1 chain length determinant protein EpsF [Nitrosospira briensis]SFO30598.1 chain length determinant protein EpsF [Nitrosospira briensis]